MGANICKHYVALQKLSVGENAADLTPWGPGGQAPGTPALWMGTWERTPNLDPGSGPNHRHHLNFPWWKVDPECLRTGGLQDPRLRAQVQLLRMLIPKVRAQDTVCAQGASCSPQIGSAGSQGRGGGAVCAPRSSLLPGLITCVDQSSG